jgi:hypothetical protein
MTTCTHCLIKAAEVDEAVKRLKSVEDTLSECYLHHRRVLPEDLFQDLTKVKQILLNAEEIK